MLFRKFVGIGICALASTLHEARVDMSSIYLIFKSSSLREKMLSLSFLKYVFCLDRYSYQFCSIYSLILQSFAVVCSNSYEFNNSCTME